MGLEVLTGKRGRSHVVQLTRVSLTLSEQNLPCCISPSQQKVWRLQARLISLSQLPSHASEVMKGFAVPFCGLIFSPGPLPSPQKGSQKPSKNFIYAKLLRSFLLGGGLWFPVRKAERTPHPWFFSPSAGWLTDRTPKVRRRSCHVD